MRINGRPATPAQTRRTGTAFVVVGLVLAVVMGGACLLVGLLGPDRGEWPTTPGVVSANERSADVDVDDAGSGSDPEYQRVVTYTVDGREYSEAMGAERSRQYPTGEQVTVSYNPEDPGDAELEGETSLVLLVVGGAGVLFGAVFAGIGMLLRRSARNG